ncbi:PQQ-binding-like beta-propeller repeat protein [Isoptericola sp. AK164]|uniref:outer membrane protein assembly factor BamB family protein n=1 Tax=Isoptericola sp. AK164 TaxID=3024246 RepID=UPI0024184B7B|nr:PQQ-binding-like beta-propeller repeat protein [Isoptericola sp. AK164]
MARRRDDAMVSFDVSVDTSVDAGAGHDGGARTPEPPRPGWLERAAAWWRAASPRRRRATVGVGGGAVLVLVGGLVAGGAAAAHLESERLRAAPGGVLSLAGELTEAWSRDGSGVVAVLDGGRLAFVEDRTLVVHDAADGSEVWRAALGPDLECGPRPRLSSGVEWTMPSTTLTCVHGDDGERTVTVLDADGAVVGDRVLDPEVYGGEHVRVAPAAAGGLAVVEHVIDLPGRRTVENSPTTQQLVEEIDPNGLGAATLRVEDALTGQVRAESTANRWPMSLQDCVWFSADAEGRPRPATTRIELWGVRQPVATPSVVGYQMCQGGTGLATDGTPLDVADVTGVSFADLQGLGVVEPFPGGGQVVPGPRGGTVLVTAEEGRREDLGGRVRVPVAQVGPVEPELVVVRELSTAVGIGGDGAVRWEAELGGDPDVLARAAGTTVVATDASSELVALDDADGRERWRVDLVHPAPDGRWVQPTSAVTDGERVTVALVEGLDGGPTWAGSLVTVDLATGDARRTELDGDGLPWVTAVDGHLLLHELDPGGGGFAAWPRIAAVKMLEPR